MVGWLEKDELERCWKEVVRAYMRKYANICLGRLRTKRNLRTASIPAKI
jgi:hypothetical protein